MATKRESEKEVRKEYQSMRSDIDEGWRVGATSHEDSKVEGNKVIRHYSITLEIEVSK